MNCQEFQMRLDQVLDARRPLAADPELADHARSCCDCGELLQAAEALLAGLRARAQSRAPRNLGRRVVAETASRSETRSRAAWAFSLAAAVLVLLALHPWLQFKPRAGTAVDAQPLSAAPAPETQVTMPPSVADPPAQPPQPDRYQVLARVTTRMAGDLAAASQQVWVEPLADGIRPVKDSMAAALSRLRPGSTIEDVPGPARSPTTQLFHRDCRTFALA